MNLSLTFQILRVSGRERKLKVLANTMVCILYIRNYFMCEDDQEGLYIYIYNGPRGSLPWFNNDGHELDTLSSLEIIFLSAVSKN